jgi:hypothetical protein
MENTMKFEIQANANDTITPHAIFAVNGPMVARTVTLAEAQFIVTTCNAYNQLVAENANLRQDLSGARNGWEQATEAVREAEEVRDKLVAALKAIVAIEDKAFGGDWDEIEQARGIARAALAAAEAA